MVVFEPFPAQKFQVGEPVGSVRPVRSDDGANFTVLTGLEQAEGSTLRYARLGKRYSWNGERIVKESAPGSSIFGIASVKIDSLHDLANQLDALGSCQAICSSVFKNPAAQLVLPRKSYQRHQDNPAFTTRTKKDMEWPDGPGILSIDIDPQGDKMAVLPKRYAQPFSRSEIIDRFFSCIDVLDGYSYILRPSSSAYIMHPSGVKIGAGGWRLYFMVENARDIPRASKAIYERLWLYGEGYGIATAAGSYQDRSMIDMAIYQPARLDYAGKPTLVDGLKRYGPGGKTKVVEGEPTVNTRKLLKNLKGDDATLVKELIEANRRKLAPKCAEVRYSWAANRVMKRAESSKKKPNASVTKKLIEDEIRSADRGVLVGHHEVWVYDDGQKFSERKDQIGSVWSKVTVETILQDPETFHDVETLDPLEPEYHDYGQCGIIYADGNAIVLWSQAHGGKKYILAHDEAEVKFLLGALG